MIRDVHEGLLFTGDALSARKLQLIYDHQIAAVVDLAANEPPAVLGRDIIYCRFPLHDDGSNVDALLSLAIGTLQSLLQCQFRTLIACSAGMSRSPTVAAAVVSLLTNDTLPECLHRITRNAPHDVSPSFFADVVRVHAAMATS